MLQLFQRTIFTGSAWFCTAAIAIVQPTQPATSKAPPWPVGFRAIESLHFIVRSDAAPGRVEQLLNTAEETYSAVADFANKLQLPTPTPAARMQVLLYDAWEEYRHYASQAGFTVHALVPGFFDEAANRCHVFNIEHAEVIVKKRQELLVAQAELRAATAESHDEDTRRTGQARQQRIREIEQQLNRLTDLLHTTVIRHEIAHQVLFNLGVQKSSHRDRRWLKEGLAMQFETTALPNAYRLADLRGISWSRSRLSAERLVTEPSLLGPGATSAQEAYAASYALVNYLIDTQPTALRDYLQQHGRQPFDAKNELAQFEEVFGNTTPEFDRRWREYNLKKNP